MAFNSKSYKIFVSILLIQLALIVNVVANCNGHYEREILFLADGQYYSHFVLATFLIADYGSNPQIRPNNAVDLDIGQEVQSLTNGGIRSISVPMDHAFERSFFHGMTQMQLPSNWAQETISTDLPVYWKMSRCRTVTFYQAVIRNTALLERLKSIEFSLGIAEIGSITSGFALFYELGIVNTIATSATPAMPVFYHFLGLGIPIEVPEHYSAQRGDGLVNSELRIEDSERQNTNRAKLEEFIYNIQNIYSNEYDGIYVNAQQYNTSNIRLKPIPPLSQLFANVRYFLVNHASIAAYPRPINEKIGYIGGISIGEQMLEVYREKLMTGSHIHSVYHPKALYAAVPVICIPLLGDQRYNTSVVEYLGVGMWVSAPEFHHQFPEAMEAVLGKKYKKIIGFSDNSK
uniref:glucuronosyltransferase n=1 Tax=Meloidogyne hapla TaxID=6305 RepID=A0A1I8BX84_MELHA